MPRTGETSRWSHPPWWIVLVEDDEVPAQGQQEREGLFGDALLVGPGGDRQGHLVGRGGLDVDEVVADARPGDDPEPGGDREHLGRHPLAPREQGIGLGQEYL